MFLGLQFPSSEAYAPAIARFEQLHPEVKVELTILESKNLQEKVPLALATEEDIDVVGVQSGQMSVQVAPSLLDLDPVLLEIYRRTLGRFLSDRSAMDISAATTGGTLKYLPMLKIGAMVGYYNVGIFRKYGLSVPRTIEEFHRLAETLHAKDRNILAASFNARDAWMMDEMMLTVMAQSGDYHNQWRYKGAPVDDIHFVDAMQGLKRFFDLDIFSRDLLDFDYGARARNVYHRPRSHLFSRDSGSRGYCRRRSGRGKRTHLDDVGAFALPLVKEGGKPALRAFVDGGAGIVATTRHPKAAAQWLAFMMFGEGTDILSQHVVSSFLKTGIKHDPAIFTSNAARQGIALIDGCSQHRQRIAITFSSFSDVGRRIDAEDRNRCIERRA